MLEPMVEYEFCTKRDPDDRYIGRFVGKGDGSWVVVRVNGYRTWLNLDAMEFICARKDGKMLSQDQRGDEDEEEREGPRKRDIGSM